MTVPDCPEWRVQPGYETSPCWCVRVAKTAWPDCTSCGGTGVIGTVPIRVWECVKESLPKWVGDPRFDPRARFPDPPVERPRLTWWQYLKWLLWGVNK